MIKYFLVPMSSPPWGRENPQRPLYVGDLNISWSGITLKNSLHYVIKAGCSDASDKFIKLQEKDGVIDFPNVLEDKMDKLPKDRQDKNDLIKEKLGIIDEEKHKTESVSRFIDRVVEKGGKSGWEKDMLFVAEE